jgi:hypothetical protein
MQTTKCYSSSNAAGLHDGTSHTAPSRTGSNQKDRSSADVIHESSCSNAAMHTQQPQLCAATYECWSRHAVTVFSLRPQYLEVSELKLALWRSSRNTDRVQSPSIGRLLTLGHPLIVNTHGSSRINCKCVPACALASPLLDLGG